MEDWQEIVYNLSTGATFSDLEWPLTHISRARVSMSNISETVQDRHSYKQ